ncbi:MAG: PepSY domain-containing protein, partial [Cellulosilyticum sp.]|nr:PepSY domain-containing protein [Cellulosilyticum sp.]
DYEISAIDGKIIKYDHEIEYANSQNNVATNTQGSTQNNATNNTNSTANISADKAKQIALSHAGLTSSQVTFKRTELEFDDGISKYEVEFYYNNREYSYEINAKTGAILSYEQD